MAAMSRCGRSDSPVRALAQPVDRTTRDSPVVVAGSLARARTSCGLPFGATVGATDYLVLPAAKLYEPIWKYEVKTLAKDLSANLVYGLATAATLRVLSR
jgi:hypothetical protein